MNIENFHIIDNQRAVLKGAVNYQTVNFILQQGVLFLSNTPSDSVTIELSELSTVNSVTLALFVEWQKASKIHHKKLSFSHLSTNLLSAIKANNLEAVINIL